MIGKAQRKPTASAWSSNMTPLNDPRKVNCRRWVKVREALIRCGHRCRAGEHMTLREMVVQETKTELVREMAVEVLRDCGATLRLFERLLHDSVTHSLIARAVADAGDRSIYRRDAR